LSQRIKILVTGASGQLGHAIKKMAGNFPSLEFHLLPREQLSLTDNDALNNFFLKHSPDWCINTAAYTLVDKSEIEKEQAMLVNGAAVGNLASLCKVYNTSLIHISTDYVFDGNGTSPYTANAPINPINTYGVSKAEGERQAISQGGNVYIIRTSWVYGKEGNNFVKTMIRLMKDRAELGIVNDQFGCPTNASDLAEVIMKIILSHPIIPSGIYHYSNSGVTTWYHFALAIKELTGSTCEVRPVDTASYPTPAKRPAYSVMDTSKISKALSIDIINWRESLKAFLKG